MATMLPTSTATVSMRPSWWPVAAALKALISLSRRSWSPASASPTANRTSLIIALLPGDGRRPAPGAGQGYGCAGSGLLDQDGAGIEQIEALTLRVLLGFRSWLGDDDGDVAAVGGRVGEAGGQQPGL